jgi:hypothetical protein
MVSRISYLLWFTALAIAAYLFIHFTREDSGPRPAYIGSVRCQPCHESQRVGDQYGIWLHSDHSRAYSALGSDSAREYLARTESTLDSCVSCHATLGRIGVNEAERAIDSEGVGCERCHGPGSEYAFFNIMRDRDDFTSHGGVVGSLDDCYGCHARDIGSDERRCPFQTTNFDADSEWAIIGHPTPTSDSATQTTNND